MAAIGAICNRLNCIQKYASGRLTVLGECGTLTQKGVFLKRSVQKDNALKLLFWNKNEIGHTLSQECKSDLTLTLCVEALIEIELTVN